MHLNSHSLGYLGKVLFRNAVAVIAPIKVRTAFYLFGLCDRKVFNPAVNKGICAGFYVIVRAEGVGQSEKSEGNAGKQNRKHKSYLLVLKPARAYFKGVFKG